MMRLQSGSHSYSTLSGYSISGVTLTVLTGNKEHFCACQMNRKLRSQEMKSQNDKRVLTTCVYH